MTRTNLADLTPDEKRALLTRLLAEKEKRGGQQHFPLSFAQERLWFIDRLQPGTTVYSIPAAIRLRGQLDAVRLCNCIDAIIARHESLRSRFVSREGIPAQVVDQSAPLELIREHLPAGMAAIESRLQALVEEPFDLERGPLIRCRLFSLGHDDHVLALVVHHIVADYWSLQILITELIRLYGAKGEPLSVTLPPLPIQYPDYAVWQKDRKDEFGRQLGYWQNQLSDAPHLLPLPTDYQRPAIQTFEGARHAFRLDAALSAAVVKLSRDRGVTPFMTLLAVFQLLLHRYSGSDDICVGSTVSNRDRPELRDLIGLFVNNLVFRTRFEGAGDFDGLLARVRSTALEAFAHQEAPFEQVVDALNVERNLSHNALFQAMFVLHNTERQNLSLAGLELTTIPFNSRAARFDISLDMYEGDGFSGVFEFNASLFHPETIARLAGHFALLLKAVTNDPARPLATIDLLLPAEHEVHAARNRTKIEIPQEDVATLFERRAAQRGSTAAVRFGDEELSYTALNAAANRLAAQMVCHLDKADGQPRIAICLPRSAEMIVAILAVLKLGAVYIPLDPTHPAERLASVLDDADATLLIVRDRNSLSPQLFEAGCPFVFDVAVEANALGARAEGNPARTPYSTDLAYIIFTSGSTGRPKGVPIRQESLVNLLTSMAREPGMDENDIFVAVTTPSFDIATLELLLPLLTGGTLVIAPAHTVYDDLELSRLLRDSKATMMQATPATWRLLIDGGWRAPDGFRMLCGGEALDPLLATRLLAGGGELWNLYGPTETTIWSACTRLHPEQAAAGIISIGDPIANTQVHVLDRNLLPVPEGVVGQLYIGGLGLSPGYLDRDDLTAAAFVANPLHAADPAAHSDRLYRTGDAVRRLRDGSLVYLGRLDFQVKLRGFRIELSEIEAALNADPCVEQAVVTLMKEGDSDGELVAYCRLAPAHPADPQQRLRAMLSAQLPAYMIPSIFVYVDAFPLNTNGKVDRKRLPRPQAADRAEAYVAPQTSTEALVADLWSEILGRARIGREDQFFEQGGHSLLAARMIARLRPVFNVTLPLRTLFEKPRLKDFAGALDDAGATGLPSTPAGSVIPLLPRGGPLPLSYAQQRQWTLAQLEPLSPFYNIPGAIRLKTQLNVDRLARALELLCQRQEVLRSRFFSSDGRAMVDILPQQAIRLDIEAVDPENLETALMKEAGRPFDLAEAPAFRVRLYATGPNEHVLLLVLHHIVADALSVTILIRDLAEIYGALAHTPPILPAPLPVQYADFAAWQRSQGTVGQLDYWREALKDAPRLLEMPTDFPRPAQQEFDGDSVGFHLDADTSARMKAIADSAGATPFMAVLAAFAHLLGRYSDMDDIVVGSPVAQRPHAELEGVVGMFVNTLALRLRCDGDDSFASLLLRARATTLDAFAHQDVPFEQVVDALDLPRNWSYNPLFQTMFVWQTEESGSVARGSDLDWQPVSLPVTTAKVDISLLVHDGRNGISGRFEYRTDLFRRETIVCMAEAFVTLIQAVTTDPARPLADHSLLNSNQKRRIRAWNSTDRSYSDAPAGLHQLVEAAAARTPDAVAVTDCEHSITYGALESRADRLAAKLVTMGIGRGSNVGICLSRRIDLIAAILAVLKTGAAYVPLDPRYPQERIAFIAEDADLALLLASDGSFLQPGVAMLDPSTVRDEAGSVHPVPAAFELDGGDLAYIIYTSGSTGRPKGVALEHRNAVSFVRWCLEEFTQEQLSGVLASTSVCFDLSIFEIFVTLAAGGRVLLVDDLFAIPDAPFSTDITLINTVPTPMAELLKLGPLPPNAATVCLAGEPLPPRLAERIHDTGSVKALYNLYGPSEDTTYSTAMCIPPHSAFGIGAPIANTRAYVLDAHLHEVPIGMPGELYLSGAGIARGYWNRPDLTAERFVPNPYAAATDHMVLYRTGDRARWLHDGTLSYLGRTDRQMKLHGFRIEPGEIETAILRYGDISAAAVDIWRDASDNARLVAWVETTAAPSSGDLASYLRSKLPEHFVPALFAFMEKLPRLPNGKLDRKALPDPLIGKEPSATAPPQGRLEQQLADIWSRLLGLAAIARHDNFFALGGDSIMAIQAVAQARQSGIALSPRDIFQHPTLADLATAVAGRSLAAGKRDAVTGEVPLTPIQLWFFDGDRPGANHFNQGVVLKTTRLLAPDLLEQALKALPASHDALRARFRKGPQGWEQHYPAVSLQCFARIPGAANKEAVVASVVDELHRGFDLADGPVFGARLIDFADGEQRLAIAAHHLVIDGVSWRILLEELQAYYLALEAGEALPAAVRGSSITEWVGRLAASTLFDGELPYWSDIVATTGLALPLDHPGGENLVRHARAVERSIDTVTTRKVLQDAPSIYPVEANDLLVTALFLTIREWTGEDRLIIELESHGRPDIFDDIDLSRTVGWLTGLYPVLLEASDDSGTALLSVKDILRRVPHDGIGYGVLKYLKRRAGLQESTAPAQIRFNYLGRMDNLFPPGALFSPSGDRAGPLSHEDNPRDVVFEVNVLSGGGRLHVQWNYGGNLHRPETVERLADRFCSHLSVLAEHCLNADDTGYTPSDFPQMDFDQSELDEFLRSL